MPLLLLIFSENDTVSKTHPQTALCWFYILLLGQDQDHTH